MKVEKYKKPSYVAEFGIGNEVISKLFTSPVLVLRHFLRIKTRLAGLFITAYGRLSCNLALGHACKFQNQLLFVNLAFVFL